MTKEIERDGQRGEKGGRESRRGNLKKIEIVEKREKESSGGEREKVRQ